MQSSQLQVTEIKCVNCGKAKFSLDPDTQEIICISCGCVIRTRIEERVEWRSFQGEEESRIRVGLPPNLMMADKGLSTMIGGENEDASGIRIGGNAKRDLNRLRKWQQRISFYSSKERNLAYSLNELKRIGAKLKVPPSILAMASYIYRMAMEKDLVRGRSSKKLITASLYVAIRHEEFPRTLKELSQASEIDRSQITKNLRMLLKDLKIKLPPVDPVNFVAKICSEADLSKKVMLESKTIIRFAQKERLTAGKDPTAVAAAATHYACTLLDVEITQQEIANAAGLSEITIRNLSRGLKNTLELEKATKHEIEESITCR